MANSNLKLFLCTTIVHTINNNKLLMSYTFDQVHKQNVKMKMKKLKKKMEVKGEVFDLEIFQDKKRRFEQVKLHFVVHQIVLIIFIGI